MQTINFSLSLSHLLGSSAPLRLLLLSLRAAPVASCNSLYPRPVLSCSLLVCLVQLLQWLSLRRKCLSARRSNETNQDILSLSLSLSLSFSICLTFIPTFTLLSWTHNSMTFLMRKWTQTNTLTHRNGCARFQIVS